MLMLDLCAGLGGASQAMIKRGWTVVTVDNDPSFHCTVTTDIKTWRYAGPMPDLIWASPPCTEFSRESMPWLPHTGNPDMSLMLACKAIIDHVRPLYWVIENVRGAFRFFQPILGRPKMIVGPFYLWGFFPPITSYLAQDFKNKESYSSTQRAKRAQVPFSISDHIADAIERQGQLWQTHSLS